ncbi:amidohydrolase family protein [Saccharopolyspora shandongensis]|uniref:amidohydrolase family protein n=1 Tax=Saccharopolyspora shandongensis TaxID=418495 RepID=UPI003421D8D0
MRSRSPHSFWASPDARGVVVRHLREEGPHRRDHGGERRARLDALDRRGDQVVRVVGQRRGTQVQAGVSEASYRKIFDVRHAGLDALEKAHRAGVNIAYGTDLLGPMHAHQLDEFALRAEVQPNADLIRSATTTAARLLGMTGQIGTLAKGVHVDLLVVEEPTRRPSGPDQTHQEPQARHQSSQNDLTRPPRANRRCRRSRIRTAPVGAQQSPSGACRTPG